jgi:hypothetical protein
VLLALTYCHKSNILHRDVKPENILSASSGVKLSDFGVAKILENVEDCRSTSGTHGYMPPEVYAPGHRHGTAAEWFAVGITLHEMVTGRRPFEAHRLQCKKGRGRLLTFFSFLFAFLHCGCDCDCVVIAFVFAIALRLQCDCDCVAIALRLRLCLRLRCGCNATAIAL